MGFLIDSSIWTLLVKLMTSKAEAHSNEWAAFPEDFHNNDWHDMGIGQDVDRESASSVTRN